MKGCLSWKLKMKKEEILFVLIDVYKSCKKMLLKRLKMWNECIVVIRFVIIKIKRSGKNSKMWSYKEFKR